MKDGLVIGVIEEIHQNSIYVKLLDSDKKGFINVSNIPGLWIRELKKKFKAGQLIVAKIIKEDDIFELSLKGISKYDKEKKLQEYDLTDTHILVDDVRFVNELDVIKKQGGMFIKIERPGFNGANNHSSESSLDHYDHWDLIIENDGSLERFKQKVVEQILPLLKTD